MPTLRLPAITDGMLNRSLIECSPLFRPIVWPSDKAHPLRIRWTVPRTEITIALTGSAHVYARSIGVDNAVDLIRAEEAK